MAVLAMFCKFKISLPAWFLLLLRKKFAAGVSLLLVTVDRTANMGLCRQQPGGGLQGGPAPYRGGRGGHGLLPYRQGGSGGAGGAASGAGGGRRYRPY